MLRLLITQHIQSPRAGDINSAILEWTGNAGRVVSLLDGREESIPADALVFASVNHAEDSLARELEARGITFAAIGDCIAARQAPYAIHEGRKIALGL